MRYQKRKYIQTFTPLRHFFIDQFFLFLCIKLTPHADDVRKICAPTCSNPQLRRWKKPPGARNLPLCPIYPRLLQLFQMWICKVIRHFFSESERFIFVKYLSEHFFNVYKNLLETHFSSIAIVPHSPLPLDPWVKWEFMSGR